MANKPARTTHTGLWSYNPELFKKKYIVEEVSGCWIWQGATSPSGALFGCVKNGKPQMTQARRVAYMIETGEDCSHLEFRHRCDHGMLCVNPQHWESFPNRKAGLTWGKE
jgi:hypothetical protein